MPAKKWAHMNRGGIQKNRRKRIQNNRNERRHQQQNQRKYSDDHSSPQLNPQLQRVADVLSAPQGKAMERLLSSSPAGPRPEIATAICVPPLQLPEESKFARPRSNSLTSEISVISTATTNTHRTNYSSRYSYGDDDDPQVPVYMLVELESILQEARPGCFIALDIDETLIVTRNSPSLLLTTNGVQSFQQYVHKRFDDFATKNQYCRQLQKALKDKVLVQEDTARVVEALQKKGCLVFGLTARYGEMANMTDASLVELGMDLSNTSPFPREVLRDTATDILIQNGIIYCSNQDKGHILRKVFEAVVLKSALESVRALEAQTTATSNDIVDTSIGDSDAGQALDDDAESAVCQAKEKLLAELRLPEELYFVDDIYENSSSVCAQLTPILTDELGMTVSCYHYVPPNLAELQADAPCEPEHAKNILEKQMEVFVDRGVVMTNDQTRRLLGLPPSM